jgi:hypothetical protein
MDDLILSLWKNIILEIGSNTKQLRIIKILNSQLYHIVWEYRRYCYNEVSRLARGCRRTDFKGYENIKSNNLVVTVLNKEEELDSFGDIRFEFIIQGVFYFERVEGKDVSGRLTLKIDIPEVLGVAISMNLLYTWECDKIRDITAYLNEHHPEHDDYISCEKTDTTESKFWKFKPAYATYEVCGNVLFTPVDNKGLIATSTFCLTQRMNPLKRKRVEAIKS